MDKSNILIVDDDVEDQFILKQYFTEFNFQGNLSFCENGHQAVTYLEEIENDESLPHLIVLDLNMPILNGTQTLQQLKQIPRLKNIPIVIFSTSENETERRKCLSLGAVDYMVKPLTLAECQNTIQTFLSFVHSNR
jgi:CheY-like chemotaxis protein